MVLGLAGLLLREAATLWPPMVFLSSKDISLDYLHEWLRNMPLFWHGSRRWHHDLQLVRHAHLRGVEAGHQGRAAGSSEVTSCRMKLHETAVRTNGNMDPICKMSVYKDIMLLPLTTE